MKWFLGTLFAIIFASMALSAVLVTYGLAKKICTQNGKEYSFWQDQCVERGQ